MIYLDNAATTFPKPSAVYEEVANCMKTYAANPGRSSHDMSLRASTKIMECRKELSSLFNIENMFNLVFTSNATEGLNIAIKGLFSKGDHLISTKIEHNSVFRPLNYLQRNGIDTSYVSVDKQGFVNVEDIKKEIRKNTKAIIVNHASNVLGSIQNISEIGELAKAHGLYLIVDASQSAGVIPIDVQKDNIDVLAFPGHKGLLGPQGTGGLYIREGIEIREFKSGGTGSNSDSTKQPDFLPDRFESGTLNTPGIAGLCEGVKFIRATGVENIHKHEMELMAYLLKELKKLSYVKIYGSTSIENRCAVISINLEGFDSSEVGYILNEKGIAVRTGFHCAPFIHDIIGTASSGTVRISPGFYNTIKDIEIIVNAIIEINKGF